MRDGLIHSIHITSIPILLGKGIRLFSDDGARQEAEQSDEGGDAGTKESFF